MGVQTVSNNTQDENKAQMPRIVYVNGNGGMNELMQVNSGVEQALQFGTYEHDFAANNSKYSSGLYEILGYTESYPALGYDTFSAHIVGRKQERNQDMGVANAEVPYAYECEVMTNSNARKKILLSGRRYYDSNGKLYKDIGMMHILHAPVLNKENASNTISELQRSNKELESFAYVASHDLQEPVRKITTFSSRLIEKLSDELKNDDLIYLKRILSSAESMRMLIDNLLEYSRISRNNQPLGEVNLNFVLQQVQTDLELIIDETGATINAPTLPTIHASIMQMKQLFTNIINNAIKFRKPGLAPEITIQLETVTAREKELYQLFDSVTYHKIQVIDNGIGFENEYAVRIFDIFQRLHGKAEYPGSGIGLAICKKIVEYHNGVIYAENIPGQGACFSIILPDSIPEH